MNIRADTKWDVAAIRNFRITAADKKKSGIKIKE